MARFALRIVVFAAVATAVTMLPPAQAAHARRILQPPATAYRYAGNAYDRFFSALSRARFVHSVPPARRDPRLRTLAAAPYVITDLTPIAGNALPEPDPSLGIGFPTAVDNAGRIPYYDQCGCVGNFNDITIEINDSGTLSTILYETDNFDGEGYAIPAGVSPNGNIAGTVYTQYGEVGDSLYEQVIAWLESGPEPSFQSVGIDYTSALAINDAGVSVGNDTGTRGSFAAMFSVNGRGVVGRKLLLPPKPSWTGVATGINDADEIVGYATLPGSGSIARAVRFYPTANAQVIPVAAAGVSAAAQALNAHGDIVGSAGSQAFLYRYNRVTYLPLPPGDGGNAVAYAVNASDEIVGDIMGPTSTAFLYKSGRAYDLNALLPANSGWQITDAYGINDAGQIVGQGYFAGEGGQLVGFSMKPRP